MVGLHSRSLFLREKLDCTGLFVAVTGRFSSVAARGMPQGAITDRLPPCPTLAPRRPPTIASPAPSRGFINRSYHYNSQITRTVLSLSFFFYVTTRRRSQTTLFRNSPSRFDLTRLWSLARLASPHDSLAAGEFLNTEHTVAMGQRLLGPRSAQHCSPRLSIPPGGPRRGRAAPGARSAAASSVPLCSRAVRVPPKSRIHPLCRR